MPPEQPRMQAEACGTRPRPGAQLCAPTGATCGGWAGVGTLALQDGPAGIGVSALQQLNLFAVAASLWLGRRRGWTGMEPSGNHEDTKGTKGEGRGSLLMDRGRNAAPTERPTASAGIAEPSPSYLR